MQTQFYSFNKRKKTFVSMLMLFILLFQLLIPVAVFAKTSEVGSGNKKVSDTLQQYYDYAEELAGKQGMEEEGEVNEDAVEAAKKVIEGLKGADISLDPTVQGGYNIIDEVRIDAELPMIFGSIWKQKFREEAQSLGVKHISALRYDVDENGSLSVETADASGDFSDAVVKVNILTWDNKKINGEAVASINEGSMMELLGNFDNQNFWDNFVRPIAGVSIALIVAFGCMSLINLSMEKSVSSEAVIREFVKIGIGIFIIYNFRTIALWIISFGSWVLQRLQTSLGGNDYQAANVEYALIKSLTSTLIENNVITEIQSNWMIGIGNVTSGLASMFGQGFDTLTGMLGNGIVQLASSLAVYSVAIEIGVRYAFTPIAIADLYSEKFRSSGMQWLKKLLACALTGAVMYVVIYSADIFKNAVGATFSVITNTAINLTMIGMLFRARQIANDIVGVH